MLSRSVPLPLGNHRSLLDIGLWRTHIASGRYNRNESVTLAGLPLTDSTCPDVGGAQRKYWDTTPVDVISLVMWNRPPAIMSLGFRISQWGEVLREASSQ